MSAAKVIVTYNSEQAKSVTQTINRHTGRPTRKDRAGVLRQGGDQGGRPIGLTAQEMGMESGAYEKWKESLRNWGQQQVEQILSSQTGIDMSLNLLNDVDGFDKFESKLANPELHP